MGLLRAGMGAVGGVLADSWREYFYCNSLDANTLVAKGHKRTSAQGRSSNTLGEDNIISDGSVIAVNEDPDAPIFGAARYRVVGDCIEVASALVEELEGR